VIQYSAVGDCVETSPRGFKAKKLGITDHQRKDSQRPALPPTGDWWAAGPGRATSDWDLTRSASSLYGDPTDPGMPAYMKGDGPSNATPAVEPTRG